MTMSEMRVFLIKEFPQIGPQFEIMSSCESELVVRLKVDKSHLRPGGTVSGPSMFSLADVAFYMATLARIGPRALAVTTSCSIDFMRRPAAGDIIAHARVLKLGRQLCVGDVLMYSEGNDKPVAHANLTYAIPPAGVEVNSGVL